MRRALPDWVWLPVGAAIGLACARVVLAPRIVDRSPSAGTTVPASAELRIAFDQAMDAASVTERLHIEPSTAGEILWEGDTLIYRPQAWPSGAQVVVWLEAGARSRRGLGMLSGTRWSFKASEPRLVYLWPADGAAQVYSRGLADAAALALTAAPGGVTDFSLDATGTRLAYAAAAGSGTTELRVLDLVGGEDRLWFACPPGEECSSPEISPDGRRLAFVRASPQGEGAGGAPTRVWMLESDEVGPAPVSPDGEVALAPAWSPQGRLAYVDATRGTLAVIDVEQGEPFAPLAVAATSLGERGRWSPDGRLLIYPDLVSSVSSAGDGEDSLAGMETHLLGWDVLSGTVRDLTAIGERRAQDSSPAFTPDGQWVVFSRRSLMPGEWTPGKQLWRMRPDGSQAEQLTQEADVNHGAPAVGPQGEAIAYLRFDTEAPLDPAQIWWFDLETRSSHPVVEGGYLPAWIP